MDEYLRLRDHLRTGADDREPHEGVKRSLLIRRWDDMNDHSDAKNDVILAIKTRAKAGRR